MRATRRKLELSWNPVASEDGDLPVLIMPTGPADEHEKVMLIDRAFATVGTANFDNRSFRLNFEITAGIADEEFATQVERMFEADFAKSRVMDPGETDRKPWWFRFGVRLARLTAPIQ